MSDEPISFGDLNNAEECVTGLASGLSQMKAKFEQIKSENVVPAFSKFDKDGNGTIDP
jgi:Ca2+-binding EF-hand superfamily protein